MSWQKEDNTITKTYEFEDFQEAMEFVNNVAELAEEAQHHPDIDIRYNEVTLTLTTHDQGAVTDKDAQLAAQIDKRL